MQKDIFWVARIFWKKFRLEFFLIVASANNILQPYYIPLYSLKSYILTFPHDTRFSGSKRKYVSSPESSSPVNPPRTGHRRSKRQEKRVRRIGSNTTACKTLFDYMSAGELYAFHMIRYLQLYYLYSEYIEKRCPYLT